MESRPTQGNPPNEMFPLTEDLQLGRSLSFTRKNRGKREEILDEEAKKRDDDFWQNNSLFKDEEVENSQQDEVMSSEEEENPAKESENENGDMGDDNMNEEEEEDEDDDEDDEDYEEQMMSSDDGGSSFGDEESQTNKGKSMVEEQTNQEKPQEEEDERMNLFLKNRDRHFFFRPIFFQFDIQDLERQNFSYVKLPADHRLASGRTENDISRRVINRDFIGVPPKAPEEYRIPMNFPTSYSSEMFKMEDERYHIDLNIQRYKHVIKSLEAIYAMTDEEAKLQKLDNILKSNKLVRQKYDLDETEDRIERIISVSNEIQHDLENLYKKRAHSDITTRRKKELVYPLAVREKEVRYANNERSQFTNSKIINEISRNLLEVPFKKVTSSPTEDIIDYKEFYETYKKIFFENDLHRILFKDQEFHEKFNDYLHGLFLFYRASPYSILPSHLFYISNKHVFNQASNLVLFSIKNSSYLEPDNLGKKLTNMLQNYFGIEIGGQNHDFDIDSTPFQEVLETLTKYDTFNAETFMPINIARHNQRTVEEAKATTIPEFPISHDINFSLNKEFKLFIPTSDNEDRNLPGKATYGTHFFYFVIRYIYVIYLKLLLAYNISAHERAPFDLSQSMAEIYLNLTASYATEKIDNMRYELSLANLFGMRAKNLFNVKFLINQTIKGLLSLINDELSNDLLEKLIQKRQTNEPEQELFSFACEFINNTDEIKETENFIYRFHLDSESGWFLTSVFDVKGVFMRALKTQDKAQAPTDNGPKNSPKKITAKRTTYTETVTKETKTEGGIQQSSSSVLVKRTENYKTQAEASNTTESDPGPIKKVHVD